MSNGYQLGSGEAKPFEYVEAAPAGSASASAEAMTHFMIAHLQTGHFGDVQILKPETAILMHSRQQGWPAAMNAMALGFYEESRNGHRIIGHAGDTQWFHTDLHLILDSNVGFFVSYNSLGRAEVSPRTSLFEKFLDRYFPYRVPDEPTLSTAAEDAQGIVGSYDVSRHFETNILSFVSLLGQTTLCDGSEGQNNSHPRLERTEWTTDSLSRGRSTTVPSGGRSRKNRLRQGFYWAHGGAHRFSVHGI